MSITRSGCRSSALLACVLGLAAPLHAGGIPWHTDYQKAREEARRVNLPLLINFSTNQCTWCDHLDARTFARPEVVQFVSRHYVPLKVNASLHPQLANALNINYFPTLVYARPDGKILGYQEGFLEAPALQDQMQKINAMLDDPEWMARDLESAELARKDADYPRAIALYRKIVEDGKERPVQRKARQALNDLEQQAARRLEEGRSLAARKEDEKARQVLNEVVRLYPGTSTAAQAQLLLDGLLTQPTQPTATRKNEATELLKKAREDYHARLFMCALDRCEVLMSTYSDLPEGQEAVELARQIKGNTEWTRQACEQLNDRLGVLYLALADTWLQRGQPQQAVYYLEKIMQILPDTRHAENAQVRLALIEGQPPKEAGGEKD
jgi:tetratricopeptide (TPR) repeat protein